MFWLTVVGPGSWGRGTFCDWFGKYIELSLVGSELDAETKVRKAGNHSSSPACSNLIAAEVVDWLFELVSKVFVCQSFIVTCVLATVFISCLSAL